MVLLDFWGTNCLPCLHAIPHLRIAQERYGPAGLDVVGIAYEQAGEPAEQAKRVRAAAERHYINYTLLLGGGGNCPVRTQFGVTRLPTLVLIAENGAILWRHEGRMDRQHLDDLDGTIRHWLGTR
jgi:thiol-disulfide isomerase/thioredoxin